MSQLDETIDQIEAVRRAAADPQAAYLIRSRLRRALLGCARVVAAHQNLEKPDLPGQWAVGPTASSEAKSVVEICRRIYQASEQLCQPSESFDVRWEEGWRRLSADLSELTCALSVLGKVDRAAASSV